MLTTRTRPNICNSEPPRFHFRWLWLQTRVKLQVSKGPMVINRSQIRQTWLHCLHQNKGNKISKTYIRGGFTLSVAQFFLGDEQMLPVAVFGKDWYSTPNDFDSWVLYTFFLLHEYLFLHQSRPALQCCGFLTQEKKTKKKTEIVVAGCFHVISFTWQN